MPLGSKAAPRLATKGSGDSLRAPDGPSRQPSFEDPVLAPFGLLQPPLSRQATPKIADFAQGSAPLLFYSGDVVSGPYKFGEVPLRTFLHRLLAFSGPGWLMSIAYVDPGNLEADLQCGAQFGYMLLWALLASTSVGLGMQLIAARLGCATRKHLAEHCRDQYSLPVRLMLWVMTELAIIGSDVQEVIGCSIGLELLFGLPLPCGVVVTAAAAFLFLFLERLGTRPLELFFGVLILILALSMGGLFVVISPDKAAVLEGLTIPRMPRSAVQQVVGMLGCVVMPHNLFLHSALVQSRVLQKGEEAEAIYLYSIESAAAILTSLLINVSVVAVFAKGFYGRPDTGAIGLGNAGSYLGEAFGAPLRVIWALGLCAAGQSSTMTGAYAGQWVMQGYLELKVKPWKRAVITRSMALLPTLMVAVAFGGDHNGLDALNMYLNVLQSMVLPFAAVPLILFASNRVLMGDLALGSTARTLSWSGLALVMAANVYLLTVQFVGSGSVGVGSALGLGATVLSYVAAVLYIAWAPVAVVQSI